MSVERVRIDALTGTTRERVIVQCKAWKQSLSPKQCSDALAPLSLWEPPTIDELIIATTGRFSSDAVMWAEKHNVEGKRPRIEMWPATALERMLAGRSDVVVALGLRS